MPDVASFHIEEAKPSIQIVAGKLDHLATQAEAAIASFGLPIFQRGMALVRLVTQEVPASSGRMTIASGLREMTTPAMLDAMSQSAAWTRHDARAKKVIPSDPPERVAAILLSRAGQWQHLCPVAGVVTTPTLRPDGSILDTPGYDVATRLYHAADPALVLPRMSMSPSRADALGALGALAGLLKEFPFVSDFDRAVALSAIITTVVRGALSVAPLHAFRASTAGTGKSYLADTASSIATGRPCPVIAAGESDEETEKRLVGLLLAGFPIVSIDNINGELGGDLLCQAIERPLIRVRPLGRSEIVELESRATLFATGNALRVRGDMTRRTITCTLDAGMERPETRSFNCDPVEMVSADRGRYVAAALCIVRAYFVAGLPEELPALASFAEWSDLVRSALVWLGCADPCASMEAAREDDPELAELREVLVLLETTFGIDQGNTTREIADRASYRPDARSGEPDGFSHPDLRDALLRIAGKHGNIDTKRLGRWLLDHEGRIANGRRIKRVCNAGGGLARWAVVRA